MDLSAIGLKAPALSKHREIHSVSVVGVGLMGQSIAALHLARGMKVTIADASESAAMSGVESILARTEHFALDEFPTFSREALRHRLHVAKSDEEIAGSEIVIEAIVENARIKNRVLSRIAAHLADDAIVATNTSSLSVNDIAASLPKPEQVCGWHFCHPVAERRLVEVVRGAKTSDDTIARVVELAADLGKRPLVVPDTPGFVVNRLLSPFLNEGLELLRDGCDAAMIEDAAIDFGLPWGPLRQTDAIGIDICLRVGASLKKAYPTQVAESGLLVPFFEAGRFGIKSGAGILCDPEVQSPDTTQSRFANSQDASVPVHSPRPAGKEGADVKERMTLPPAAQAIVSKYRRDVPPISAEDVRGRLLLPIIIEAARILDEGLVSDPSDIDAAVVDGLHFFVGQGGVLRWADSVGLATVVAELQNLQRFGDRFTPPARLIEMARSNARFHG